jgi:release factor glutamine methyltransferase
MTILKQDVLAPCPPGFIQGDLVVANPPYLSGIEIDQLSSVVRKEPVLALYGGENGLDFYQNIFKEYAHLGKGVLVEIGHTQADAVNVLAHKLGFDRVSVFRDYGGRDRVVYCEKK